MEEIQQRIQSYNQALAAFNQPPIDDDDLHLPDPSVLLPVGTQSYVIATGTINPLQGKPANNNISGTMQMAAAR
jgi:hypothetical protein